MNILTDLEELIESRKKSTISESYTCRLLADETLAPRKVSEEAYEVCEAALLGNKEGLVQEIADLMFHLFVLMGQKNVRLEEVLQVLEKRRGQ